MQGKDLPISNIREVLERVKSGSIDKSIAYNSLRSILQSSVVKKDSNDGNQPAVAVGMTSQPVNEAIRPMESRPNPIDEIESSEDDSNTPPRQMNNYIRGNYNSNVISRESDYDQYSTDDQSSISTATGVTRFTKEDRRQIINKLIEKKKGDQPVQSKNQYDSPEDDEEELEQLDDEYDHRDGHPEAEDEDDEEEEGEVSSVLGSQHPHEEEWLEDNDQYDYSSDHYHRNSSNHGLNYPDENSYMQHNATPNLNSGSRSNRILRTEAVIREEMFRECTFHPQIKQLPEFYGQPRNLETPFYERVTKWQKDKSQVLKKRSKEVKEMSTQDCSFHPQINRHSYKAMLDIRGQQGQGNEPTCERLYREAKEQVENKNKFLQDEMEIQDSIERQSCTFRPQLLTKGSYNQVGPKYQYTNKKVEKPKIVTKEMKECTFTPKVKGISSNMNSAKLYLSKSVVERLTEPPSSTLNVRKSMDDSMMSTSSYHGGHHQQQSYQPPVERQIFDMTSFMDNLNGNNGGGHGSNGMNDEEDDDNLSVASYNRNHSRQRQRSSSAPRERSHSASRGGGGGVLMSTEKKQQFDNFLMRQKISVEQKSRKIAEKVDSLTPSFKPQFLANSLEMSARISQAEFLDRVERDVIWRKDKQSIHEQHSNTKYPFSPSINKRSQKLPSRSTYDLSRGDLLRKETNIRMNRLRIEQEKSSELTFQPEISKKATNVDLSTKKVISINEIIKDNDRYNQWVRDRQEQIEIQKKKAEEDRIQEQLKACTFVPKTIDCPAYVKRISQSMKIVKELRKNDTVRQSVPLKPEWR